MNDFANAVLTGFTAFTATNIDDIVILMILASQTSASFRPKHLVAGQYLGFTAIVLASLPGFFGSMVIDKVWIGLMGLIPIAFGIRQLWQRESDEDDEQLIAHSFNSTTSKSPLLKAVLNVLSPQTLNVAAITFANGADNISIYLPVFANSTLAILSIILCVFYSLIAVWCYAAFQLIRHPVVARLLTRFGRSLVPFVFISLGVVILIESKTYTLLFP